MPSSTDVNEGELPDDYEYDAVVVSGSGASVYGDERWVGPLEASVREVADAGVPVLGICFGHQVLTRALVVQRVLGAIYESADPDEAVRLD